LAEAQGPPQGHRHALKGVLVALPDDERSLITRLRNAHRYELPFLRALNDEYELRSPRAYMHPEIAAELGDRLQQVVIAWPQLVVDSLEERLDVEGFRLPKGNPDDDLWRVWQANNLDEQSQLATVDALAMRRAYIAVGTNEDDADTPLVTFESPLEVFADIDPRTRRVRSAIRIYGSQVLREKDGDLLANVQPITGQLEQYATVYEPNRTTYYDLTNEWAVLDRDEHNLGVVPIVPMINRARLADWTGRSELEPMLPLARAANKLATDMMVAAEFVAIPLRGMFGVGPGDFEDQHGNKQTALQAIMGRLLAIPDDAGTAKQFEFAAAQLSQFHDSISQLARLVASVSGLPPHFLGLATDNPPSADAIRSAEIRLVKRAERKQRAFGGAYEQAMRLVRRLQSGEPDPKLMRLETVWRDASTPTIAQSADATVKKHAEGIITTRQAREDLQYTDAQIARMEADDEKQAALDPVGQLSRKLGQDLAVPQEQPVPVA
jgi:hypothetical protein